jgi:Spy/CpxP family protein refolding chaperone
MRRLISPICLAFFLTTCAFAIEAAAQVPQAVNNERRMLPAGNKGSARPNLLRELGLSPEQMEAVRRINQERKPVEFEARQRFQNATRALNQAIYADVADEATFRARLSEFQAAQAELARIKFSTELAVRRLLTPAQLVKFRELRRRFAEEMNEMRDDGMPGPGGPGNRRIRPPGRGAANRF